MRAATEFFHKKSDSPSHDEEPDSMPRPRSLSPKKSVRFRSGTYSPGDTKSSPINVPKKSAPTLPRLELPRAPFMNNFDPLAGDPIPTGRPLDTPVLQAKEQGESYFPSDIKPEAIHGYQRNRLTPLPLRTKLAATAERPVEDPFEDVGPITKVHARRWSPQMSRATTAAAAADSASSTDSKLAGLKSRTETSERTSETLYEDDQPQLEQVEHARGQLKAHTIADASPPSPEKLQEQQDADYAMALELQKEELQRPCFEDAPPSSSEQRLPTPPEEPGRAPVDADYQPPSAQASWTIVHAQPSSITNEQRTKDAAAQQSVWTLASREQEQAVGDGKTSPSDDDDLLDSRAISRRRSQRRQPTHEDIRRRFRSSRSQPGFHWSEPSSTSAGSAAECEATFVTAIEEVTTTDPPKVIKARL